LFIQINISTADPWLYFLTHGIFLCKINDWLLGLQVFFNQGCLWDGVGAGLGKAGGVVLYVLPQGKRNLSHFSFLAMFVGVATAAKKKGRARTLPLRTNKLLKL